MDFKLCSNSACARRTDSGGNPTHTGCRETLCCQPTMYKPLWSLFLSTVWIRALPGDTTMSLNRTWSWRTWKRHLAVAAEWPQCLSEEIHRAILQGDKQRCSHFKKIAAALHWVQVNCQVHLDWGLDTDVSMWFVQGNFNTVKENTPRKNEKFP